MRIINNVILEIYMFCPGILILVFPYTVTKRVRDERRMSCLARLIMMLIGFHLMAGASVQFVFDLNEVHHSSDGVFWREFFKELVTRPPLYVMMSGMVFLFIGVCFPRKSR